MLIFNPRLQVAYEASPPNELPISSSSGMDGLSLNEIVVVSLYQEVATKFVHTCILLAICIYRPMAL